MNKKAKERTGQFEIFWRQIDTIYSDYARSIGISYTEMHILNLIAVTEDCTQKILCEKIFLPKQTVNSIITAIYKKGWIELKEKPDDRRVKTVKLTKAGQEYVDEYIMPIMEAEETAMASLSDKDSETLVRTMGEFAKVFRETLIK